MHEKSERDAEIEPSISDESSWKTKHTSCCGIDRYQVTPSCWLQIIGAYGCSEEVYRNIGILFPFTIPESEKVSANPRFRNYELALREDIDSGKSRWSSNLFVDFLIFLAKSNPIFAILFTHPLSSLRWDFRIIIALLDFLMFGCIYVYKRRLNWLADDDYDANGEKWTVFHNILFVAAVCFAMFQKKIVLTLSKCSCVQSWEDYRRSCKSLGHLLVYLYFFCIMIPLGYLAHGYIFGNKIVERRGTAVLFAFLWSAITSSCKCVLFFVINNIVCLKKIYHTILCGCCSKMQKYKVNWNHFKVWHELGLPDMLTFLQDKNLLKEIQNQAREMLKIRTDVNSDYSAETLGRDSTSFYAEKLKIKI